jgi:hypothetical protein
MAQEPLVFGLLDTSVEIGDEGTASWLRALTLSWSRYGYPGAVIEDDRVERILDRAQRAGFRYCLIQAYGHVLVEGAEAFHASLAEWMSGEDFFVTGRIVGSAAEGWGLDPTLLLVNLKTYALLGRPRFNLDPAGLVSVVRPAIGPRTLRGGPFPRWLGPSQRREPCRPGLPGRGFIEASLRGGRKVYNFDDSVLAHSIPLYPADATARTQFAGCLGLNIFKYGTELQQSEPAATCTAGSQGPGLTAGQRRFLDAVEREAQGAARTVLPFNLESHRDVAVPPEDFKGPVSTLCCGAAGFKANRILQTHCTDGRTRVVLFDASPKALEYRRLLLAEWDGEEYPRFARYAFRQLPGAEAVLAAGWCRAPEELDRADLEGLWKDELREWGGAAMFKRHWDVYRRLPHEFVACDLMTEPEKLLERLTDEASAVVWWGGAFFNVPANWFYLPEERRRRYEDWVRGLAERCPRAALYGTDHNNITVTAVRAAAYAERYFQAAGGDCLIPFKEPGGPGRSVAGA